MVLIRHFEAYHSKIPDFFNKSPVNGLFCQTPLPPGYTGNSVRRDFYHCPSSVEFCQLFLSINFKADQPKSLKTFKKSNRCKSPPYPYHRLIPYFGFAKSEIPKA